MRFAGQHADFVHIFFIICFFLFIILILFFYFFLSFCSVIISKDIEEM